MRSKTLQSSSSLMCYISLINIVLRFEIDEVVSNSFIGIIDKEKIFGLFSRVAASYTHLDMSNLKYLCLQMVNKDEIFEEFAEKNLVIVNKKIQLKTEAKPFEHCLYQSPFRNYKFPLSDCDLAFLTG